MEILEETPRVGGEAQDRAMRALEVVVGSGFTVDSRRTEITCLALCNAFRDAVPLLHLRIDSEVPRSLMPLVCPDHPQLETSAASRVHPYRGISRVQWAFAGSNDAEGKYEDTGRERETTPTDPVDALILSKVKWPEGTKDIVLWGIDQPIDHIIWPPTLKRLAFGEHDFCGEGVVTPRAEHVTFNQPLDRVIFPSGVSELLLGSAFDQPLNQITWPQELERLSLPGFNQVIHSVRWPSKLKVLEFIPPRAFAREHPGVFGWDLSQSGFLGRFNQHLGRTLPETLEVLWLSDGYDHPLSDVIWPSGLVKLSLGQRGEYDFQPRCEGVQWPSTLRVLSIVENIEMLSDYGFPPSGCKVIVTRKHPTATSEDDDYPYEPDEYIGVYTCDDVYVKGVHANGHMHDTHFTYESSKDRVKKKLTYVLVWFSQGLR